MGKTGVQLEDALMFQPCQVGEDFYLLGTEASQSSQGMSLTAT